jgi:creatinine amidohydrolase
MPCKYWNELTTADFKTIDTEKVIAILPVGSTEQHGPHLPLCVDACITEGMLKAVMALVPDDFIVLALPVMPVGKANEHIGFDGTLSLSVTTLIGLWTDIAESVFRTGVKKLMILNGHGGQTQVMDIVARDLRVRHDALVVPINWWSLQADKTLFPATEYTYGIHGGAEETSVMMHLRPDLVRTQYAQNFETQPLLKRHEFPRLFSQGVRHAWKAEDLQETGACGDATLATAELGQCIIDDAARSIVELLQEMSRFNLR